MMTETVRAGEESEVNLQLRARKLVRDYYNQQVERGAVDQRKVTLEQVYVVWFAKVLGNWKAMVGTVNNDGLYFEVTYNGETNETYVDHYEKQGQMVVSTPSIAQERRERAAFQADMHKAAVYSVQRMKEDWDYDNATIAEKLGITESVVRCLLVP
jgi:hypothetical protein